MINCPYCNRAFEPQELIGGKCPDCKFKEIEQIIRDNWDALEQNSTIILEYIKYVKQLQSERKHYRDNIYKLQIEVCQFHKYLIGRFPQIFPELIFEERICYARILAESKPETGKKIVREDFAL